jgi:hypothetical protein
VAVIVTRPSRRVGVSDLRLREPSRDVAATAELRDRSDAGGQSALENANDEVLVYGQLVLIGDHRRVARVWARYSLGATCTAACATKA